jgi:hypothetical protein
MIWILKPVNELSEAVLKAIRATANNDPSFQEFDHRIFNPTDCLVTTPYHMIRV